MIKFEPTAWTDELSVGVDVIDKDHKKLLSLLNEMNYIIDADVITNKGAIESVLSEIIDYTNYHFDREEMLMAACDYPELESHKQAHETLKGQGQRFMDNFNHDSTSFDPTVVRLFLRNWLVDHIMGMDKDYESWMQDKDDIIEKTNAEFEHKTN
jgi:hemerythrin